MQYFQIARTRYLILMIALRIFKNFIICSFFLPVRTECVQSNSLLQFQYEEGKLMKRIFFITEQTKMSGQEQGPKQQLSRKLISIYVIVYK